MQILCSTVGRCERRRLHWKSDANSGKLEALILHHGRSPQHARPCSKEESGHWLRNYVAMPCRHVGERAQGTSLVWCRGGGNDRGPCGLVSSMVESKSYSCFRRMGIGFRCFGYALASKVLRTADLQKHTLQVSQKPDTPWTRLLASSGSTLNPMH